MKCSFLEVQLIVSLSLVLLYLLHEVIEARVVAHVLAEVGEEDGQVEADLLGGLVEALAELVDVDLAVEVGVDAEEDVVDLLGRVGLLRLHGLAELLGRDPAVAVGVELEEGLAVRQVLHLEEDVEEGEQHLQVLLVLHQRVHHLLADRPVQHVALQHAQQHDDHVLCGGIKTDNISAPFSISNLIIYFFF